MINNIKISHVLATTNDFLIGVDDKLPWNCPEDLRYFKNLTNGGIVCMGNTTYKSIGSKPLPNRFNFVITSKQIEQKQNIYIVKNIEQCLLEATSFAKEVGLDKIFIIGGASVYSQTASYVDKLYWNIIHKPLNFNETEIDCMYYYQPDTTGMTLHSKDEVYNGSDLVVTTMLYEKL